jgi:NDP-sugar pyrophosphorylase family protein
MKFAIIAAGEGSRLRQEGIVAPKPLVKINGETLIDRLMRIFLKNGASEIVCICNDTMTSVSEHLHEMEQNGLKGGAVPLRLVVKSTPSSMHSFHEISRYLGDGPFVLTTVDTIFKENEFEQYVAAFAHHIEKGDADGLMGVTDYIDDEKPLYVGTNEHLDVTGYYDTAHGCSYISGGIYGLSSSSIGVLNECIARGESRMRNFQRALVRDGKRLKAYPFSKVLDIDHAGDIAKAEQFIAEQVEG